MRVNAGIAGGSVSAPFENLLAALHPDRERAGLSYRALHQRLTKFFEWQGSGAAAELADEVLDRVERRIAAGERIVSPEAYAAGVARLLLLERKKELEREEEARKQFRWVTEQPAPEEAVADAERQHDCLEKALAALSPTSREIILTYYSGDGREKIERRRRLAASLGSDLNALRVRAHRIRAQLEDWVAQCVAGAPMP